MTQISRTGTFTLLAVACLTIMVGCVIVPGLPAISRALGVEDYSAWLVTLPALGVVLFGPLVGRLIEVLGLYRALCHGLLAYGALGAAGQFLHDPLLLFADRLLLGGVTAVIVAAGTGLISAFFTGHARLAMIARQGMAIELGGVIFLAIGGILAGIGWQWPFLLYLVAWVLWLLVRCCVPAVAMAEEPRLESGDERIPAALRNVYVAAACSMIVFFAAIILLPAHLQALALSEAETGYFLSFISLVAVAGAAMMPRVARLLGEYRTLALAFACYAGGHLLFAFCSGLLWYLLAGIAIGSGFGLSVPLLNHMTVEQSHPQWRGRNLAYLSMAVFGGQFLASFLDLLSVSRQSLFAVAGLMALLAGTALYRGHRIRRQP